MTLILGVALGFVLLNIAAIALVVTAVVGLGAFVRHRFFPKKASPVTIIDADPATHSTSTRERLTIEMTVVEKDEEK